MTKNYLKKPVLVKPTFYVNFITGVEHANSDKYAIKSRKCFARLLFTGHLDRKFDRYITSSNMIPFRKWKNGQI